MKWFRERAGLRGTRASFTPVGVAMLAAAAACVTASASLVYWQSPGLMLGAGNGLGRWLENAESGSGVERALYRLMTLPGGEAFYRRSAREARPALTALISGSQKSSPLYALRAMEDEQALDFEAAERDWNSWAQKADDKAAAHVDLADFYERRLKPQEELTALEAVGNAAASERERWTGDESQQAWKAWERTLGVVDRYALGRSVAAREYAGWERRYPLAGSIYERELAFDLKGKDFDAATNLIARYRKALPGEALFPVKAEAALAAGRGEAKDGLAVFDRSFEPLWPAELVKSYYDLLVRGHQTLKTRDALRARLAANPQGGVDALKDAAKLFYIFQQQGQLEAAKAVLAEYRTHKDASGATWSADELYTLGRLLEQVQDFPEAARYYFALATDKKTQDAERKGLAGLTRLLLTAPEQPLRMGAGNLSLYKNIAMMDRGPGYLNGILSLFFNSQSPGAEFSTEDQLAVPYFHRAKAEEMLTDIDRRFPEAPERAELHARLMEAYAAYGEDNAVIHEGTGFLVQFQTSPRRVEVALAVGDVYSRTGQAEKEFVLYRDLLKELAAKADGVPLGVAETAYSRPPGGESGVQTGPHAAGTARSSEYAQVLDRYLSRLVALDRLPDALTVLRGELDRNPQDPGLYEKLAGFLEQNKLNAREEEVYQRAIGQFQDTSFGTGWYAKLARFYLRQKRSADYSALSRKVVGIFSGTDLEGYLRKAPAPDWTLALEVQRYAHDRFPHDLTFVRDLLAQYRSPQHYRPAEIEKLLREHWAESPDLRDQLFGLLSQSGRLDGELEALQKLTPEIGKGEWTALAQSNPAAEHFWMESCLWRSHFEECAGAAEALSAEYPADGTLGMQASSLERSLAYFHPEDTDKAVSIEKRLLSAKPDDLDTMARIGDIYADRGRIIEAAPYWTRMAEVHPGDANGYLQSATVFWDYFDFGSAAAQLRKARERLAEPALFGYQAGAIEESRGNLKGAIEQYVASSVGDKPSDESRNRLLALARRPDSRGGVDAATAGLLTTTAPSSGEINLRAGVLDAQHRKGDMAQELMQAIAKTESFDVLDAVTEAARSRALPEVQQQALSRQIALTSDPVHKLELRYQLVDLLQQRNPAAAAAEVEAIYHEHGKILGVVRATADYDWGHEHKPEAVTVLLDSADVAYAELKQNFQLEAARKLTELGDYTRSKKLLEVLLSQKPLSAETETALAENYARSGDEAGLESFYQAQLTAVQSSPLERGEKTMRLAQLRRGMISTSTLLGKWDAVADQYIALINAYPGDAGLAEGAALALGPHEQRDRLLSFYRKTVEASPRDARWSMVLARLETALEDYPAAIEAYGMAIHVRPEQKDLYISRADLEERLHKLDDAVADYEQLFKLSYRDSQWMVRAAEARARQGRGADAVKALEEAWISGRPQKATNYFDVATRLEQWGLLTEARTFAERAVEIAGADLLVDPGNQSGVSVYARIMARQRQTDAAFTRLAMARQQAESVPLAAVAQQVMKDGLAAVTSEEWRKQRIAQRSEQAGAGFALALKSMATVVGDYSTPEEKAQFAAWLRTKLAGAADGAELRTVYLPAVQAAGSADMEADLLWQFVEKSGDSNRSEVDAWLQLERSRVQLDGVGARLEALAPLVPAQQRSAMWARAAAVYRTQGDSPAELRMLETMESGRGTESQRLYELMLAERPEELVQRASVDSAAQFLLANGKPDQAMAGIAVRAVRRPPVWNKAFVGLTGLYLREHSSQVREGFIGALGGDPTIAERVAHAANRNEQLAGEVWFYYGSRFGEYLDQEKDAQAEGYLEAELEHTPERASAYTQLADYSAVAGRTEAALADYQHSLELKSDQPAVLDNIAMLEWKQGRSSDAQAAWRLAVKRLAAEIDARHVPETFWGDFAQVLRDAAANHQYPAIGPQVDALLSVYLARNGVYRVEPLLEAGYHAHDDQVQWLIDISAAANNPSDVLSAVRRSNWVLKTQMSTLLTRIVELEHRKAVAASDENNYALDEAESSLVGALLDEKKMGEARAQLARIPQNKLKSPQWLTLKMRVAEADGDLPQVVAQWKKHPEETPASNDIRNAVLQLKESSQRIVMRFVYQQAIDARDMSAPNFLGLAAIDLDEGNVADAVALLKRLTMIGANAYADTDSAAGLLEKQSRYAEAIQFLQPLAEAFPWEARYRTRLAVATLAGNAQSQGALKTLASVASDPKAKYVDRLAAAKLLKRHGAVKPATGSAELDLLARGGCPGAGEADQPYFVEARLAAADCAPDSKAKEQILRAGIAAAPGDAQMRFKYAWSAFAAGLDANALLAAEPIFARRQFGGQREWPVNGSVNEAGQALLSSTTSAKKLNAVAVAKFTWFAIHARERRHESDEALQLVQTASVRETDTARRKTFETEQKRLETDAARVEENAARAPKIHSELDQDRVVRPQLLPGMPFTVKKTTSGRDEE